VFGVQEDNFDLQSSDIAIVSNSKVIQKTKDLKLSKSINLKNGRIEKKRSTDIKVLSSALVSIAEKRDREAFRAIYKHYAPRVKSYLIKQGATVVSAEELSQETLMSVWRKADRYDPEKASAGTWIFTIARNKRIDAIRKIRRPEPDELTWPDGMEDAQEDALELKQQSEILADAIQNLPEKQRQLVEKAFFKELSHSEIALETGLPLGTIKSRIRLALERLRHAMG